MPVRLLAFMVDLLSLIVARLLTFLGWDEQASSSGAIPDDIKVQDSPASMSHDIMAVAPPQLSDDMDASPTRPVSQWVLRLPLPPSESSEEPSPESSPWSYVESPVIDPTNRRTLCSSPGGRHVRFVQLRDRTP